jgi:hypothetical protein
MSLLRGLAVVGVSVLAVAGGVPAAAQSCPQPGLQFILDMTRGVQPLSTTQFMPQANWPTFMHQASPLIAFAYPPGWQAIPLEDSGGLGVLLRSPDAVAALQIYAMRPSGPTTSQQAAQMSIGSLLGQGTRPQVLCAQDFQVPGVYPMTVTFLGVTDGRSIAATVASITHDPGNGAPLWVDMRSVAAPAKQFDGYMQQVFLPVFAQLQMGGGTVGGGGGEDDDGGIDDTGDGGATDDAPADEP